MAIIVSQEKIMPPKQKHTSQQFWQVVHPKMFTKESNLIGERAEEECVFKTFKSGSV